MACVLCVVVVVVRCRVVSVVVYCGYCVLSVVVLCVVLKSRALEKQNG